MPSPSTLSTALAILRKTRTQVRLHERGKPFDYDYPDLVTHLCRVRCVKERECVCVPVCLCVCVS